LNTNKPYVTQPHPQPLRNDTQTPFGSVSRDGRGNIRDVHDSGRGMDVHHGLNGSRRISVRRPDGSRVVAERGRAGYIDRSYGFRGHPYFARSYSFRGHVYQREYRGYDFRGRYGVEVYAPGRYYSPAFYGWAYYPWGAPVAFAWGWGAEPWYGSYGRYFAPYPMYASPSDWMTDYVISQNLAAAYAAQQAQSSQQGQSTQQAPAAYAQSTGQPVLTPDIKAQIATEVKAQIQLESAEAQANAQGQEVDPKDSSINRMFNDGQTHVFIASSSLDVADESGNECPLTDGDVLRLAPQQDASAPDGSLTVLASKGGKECQLGATVHVAFNDLQEMQNSMRAMIDQGLQKLTDGNGIPKPPMGTSATSPSAVAGAAPAPDPDVDAELKRQLAAADEVDKSAATPAQPNSTSMLRTPSGWLTEPAPADRNAELAEMLVAENRISVLDRTR
jgi:hypothetical protein